MRYKQGNLQLVHLAHHHVVNIHDQLQNYQKKKKKLLKGEKCNLNLEENFGIPVTLSENIW